MTANPVSLRVDALGAPRLSRTRLPPRPTAGPTEGDGQWLPALACGLLWLSLGGCVGLGVPGPAAPALPVRPSASASTAPAASRSDPAPAAASATPDFSVLRPATRAHYRELREGKGVVYQLEPSRSDIRIYAFRAGPGARFGHNHVLAVPHFSGLAWAPAKGMRGASADLGFRLSDVQVDSPALRAETGGGFATPLDADAIRGTQEHLLSAQGFDAASHPWIEASATIETGEAPLAIVDFALTLHGETHHQRVALRFEADDRHVEASGTLAFRQGDYGIKPYAVMGGLLAVDDLVAVEFHLRGVPLNGAIP